MVSNPSGKDSTNDFSPGCDSVCNNSSSVNLFSGSMLFFNVAVNLNI